MTWICEFFFVYLTEPKLYRYETIYAVYLLIRNCDFRLLRFTRIPTCTNGLPRYGGVQSHYGRWV